MSRTIVLDGSVANERYEEEYNHIVDSMVAKYQAGEDDSFESAKLNQLARQTGDGIFIFVTNPDDHDDSKDEYLDSFADLNEAMGYRLDLKAVMDHIVGKKEDWEAVENFRKFYEEWD